MVRPAYQNEDAGEKWRGRNDSLESCEDVWLAVCVFCFLFPSFPSFHPFIVGLSPPSAAATLSRLLLQLGPLRVLRSRLPCIDDFAEFRIELIPPLGAVVWKNKPWRLFTQEDMCSYARQRRFSLDNRAQGHSHPPRLEMVPHRHAGSAHFAVPAFCDITARPHIWLLRPSKL